MSIKYSDKQMKKLWQDFENIHFCDNDRSDKKFLHFPKGTYKFDIWHWFDNNYSKGLAKGLMNIK